MYRPARPPIRIHQAKSNLLHLSVGCSDGRFTKLGSESGRRQFSVCHASPWRARVCCKCHLIISCSSFNEPFFSPSSRTSDHDPQNFTSYFLKQNRKLSSTLNRRTPQWTKPHRLLISVRCSSSLRTSLSSSNRLPFWTYQERSATRSTTTSSAPRHSIFYRNTCPYPRLREETNIHHTYRTMRTMVYTLSAAPVARSPQRLSTTYSRHSTLAERQAWAASLPAATGTRSKTTTHSSERCCRVVGTTSVI